jgi:hypothetical protein
MAMIDWEDRSEVKPMRLRSDWPEMLLALAALCLAAREWVNLFQTIRTFFV